VLVPTAFELLQLAELGPFPGSIRPEPCGFGPVAAAARTAQRVVELRPRRVLLLGLAGSLDLARAPLASAHSFAGVRLDGVGVGSGAAFLPPSRLAFPQWAGEGERIDEVLPLCAGGRGDLLTVCAASATPREAARRRARYPGVVAEDMEAFGVALAVRLAGPELAVVRGISNAAGERDPAGWCAREALAAARTLALEWLARPDWGIGP
jgi:futalosine hydrolase